MSRRREGSIGGGGEVRAVRKLVARLKAIGDWLKQEWSRTPFIGVLTFVVAIAAATFGYLNYRLQIGRPEVEPGTAFLWQTPEGNLVGGVEWVNIGKQPARRGFVTLYAGDKDGRRRNKLGDGRIDFGNGVMSGSKIYLSYDLGAGQLPD
jgi:hypothetical protein